MFVKNINFGTIDFTRLNNLNPNKFNENLEDLENRLMLLSNSAINLWEKGKTNEAVKLSKKAQKIKNTLEFYKEYRSNAIELAKDYLKPSENVKEEWRYAHEPY